MMRVLAPAKINLTLEVLGRRPDGYHEICSVMQTIGLYDTMTFELATDITLVSQGLELATEDNLVVKAARLLRQDSGVPAGVAITLKKGIPAGAGLGGGSSDAAATLKALNQLWHLELSRERLVGLAAKVGSDVPFFIYGGTALVEGRGERVTPLGSMAQASMVLLHPAIAVPPDKTRRMYLGLAGKDFTDGRYTVRMIARIKKERCLHEELLYNVFETVALTVFPDLNAHWTAMKNAGKGRVNLAGSGPVLYSIFPERKDAERLYDQLSLSPRVSSIYLVNTLNQDE